MRIHADNLTVDDIRTAAKAADMTIESLTLHGSRSRDHAFNILCSGNSNRNAQNNQFKAATWDSWGIFLGIIFEIDPTAKAGTYDSAEMFNDQTYNRFTKIGREGLDSTSNHNHRWQNDGYGTQSCKSCPAQFRWEV